MDITDRIIFNVIAKIYSVGDINETPIYFAQTALENDSTGKVPYKLFSINLLGFNNCRLILICDPMQTIEKINLCTSKTFDEFFTSRLVNFENVTTINNMITNYAKR